ncbi:DUF1653 domain-containing protein [Veillonella caviae]|uniref:DUF1653 domain-containing protein n=1 Tax=Veillonella caviae TaxID=248316 RepID=UPI002352D9FB|nr:DUF1653 domain-containing protein [Veillonella caviae]
MKAISADSIVKGGLYRHFKGMYYYVLDVATHSETGELLVVYQKLYDNRDLYVRPLDMFLSDVEREKYPDVVQEKRFQLMSGRES